MNRFGSGGFALRYLSNGLLEKNHRQYELTFYKHYEKFIGFGWTCGTGKLREAKWNTKIS